MRLEGVITSLITPFKNQTLDVEGLKENINFQLENDVSGILVGGTTGEAPTLDMDEYEMLIRTAAGMIQRKVPLLVSIGESATKRSLIKMEMATAL
ncbi:MAG: dihydrodipicolinate synthase family protein, partial [Simkania sp.]|nr:dihydrodipicolinate synthase family protein [Simkania sp.]